MRARPYRSKKAEPQSVNLRDFAYVTTLRWPVPHQGNFKGNTEVLKYHDC